MKYIKYSLILLIVSLCFSALNAFAFDVDGNPITGSITVKMLSPTNTASRTKYYTNVQRLRINSTSCTSCTFNAKPIFNGSDIFSTTYSIPHYTPVSLDSNAIYTGQNWYVGVTRASVGFNITIGYTYDPNAIVL